MGLIAVVLLVGVILPSLNALPDLPESDIERHSLYYVYTALSKPISAPGIHEFTGMGVLDNRKIDYYNSIDKMKIPQQKWMRRELPSDYWEKGTQSRRSKEQWCKDNVHVLMERMRQNNSDVHVLNWRLGCEIDKFPDGSVKFIRGVYHFSYDGQDFLSFDDASMQWVAPVPEAIPTKQKWDGVPVYNKNTKDYLEKECMGWLNQFITYADEELKRSSPPQVYFFAQTNKESADNLTMICLATGFLPKDIDMFIQKRGSIVKKVNPQEVYPNGDGTHQARLVVHILKSEANDYQCSVMHRTLRAPVVSKWITDGLLPDETLSIGAIAGGAAGGAVVLIAIIVAVVMIKKNSAGNQTNERNAAPVEMHTLGDTPRGSQDSGLNTGNTTENTEPNESHPLKGDTPRGSQDSGLNTESESGCSDTDSTDSTDDV